jgi:hypothetical protein
MPKSSKQASVAPPTYQGTPERLGDARAVLVAGVVEMVRVAVPDAVPAMVTGLVEPKLKVGKSWSPAGLEVTAAVSATLPVKPPAGVRVMVDVFAVVVPGVTVTAVPLTVKLGLTAVAMVTEFDPEALLYLEELDESGVYVTVSVSLPVLNEPAGILMVAPPLVRVVAAEV